MSLATSRFGQRLVACAQGSTRRAHLHPCTAGQTWCSEKLDILASSYSVWTLKQENDGRIHIVGTTLSQLGRRRRTGQSNGIDDVDSPSPRPEWNRNYRVMCEFGEQRWKDSCLANGRSYYPMLEKRYLFCMALIIFVPVLCSAFLHQFEDDASQASIPECLCLQVRKSLR